MELNIDNEARTVEIWLNRKEKQDPALRRQLRVLCRAFAEEKYLAAVYQSGDRDLAQLTGDLLCYNRKRIAELEVRSGKQPGMPL